MGLGRTARGRSFVYQAGTTMDSVGGTCGSRGGMVSFPRSWHRPCRAWYWWQATSSLRSTQNPEHALVAEHRQPGYAVRTVESGIHHVSCLPIPQSLWDHIPPGLRVNLRERMA